jgi:hypothetical protein
MIGERSIIKVHCQNRANVNWTRYFLGYPNKAEVLKVLRHDKHEDLPKLIEDYWQDGMRVIECMYAGVKVGLITIEEYGKAVELEGLT